MNGQFIQGIRIEWNLIGAKSYLRNIEALNSLQELMFKKPVTFFVGENGSGKSTLLEAIAVSAGFNPEGGTKNYSFSTYDSHSELCDAVRLVRIRQKDIMKSHTVKVFLRLRKSILKAVAFICLMSLKRRFHRKGSLRCLLRYMSAQNTGRSLL